MNSVVFGQYYNTNSWVHKLDPRTKIISLVLMMVGIFFVNQVTTLVCILALLLLLLATTKIPLGQFLKSLRSVMFLLLFSIVFQLIAKQEVLSSADEDFALTQIKKVIETYPPIIQIVPKVNMQ